MKNSSFFSHLFSVLVLPGIVAGVIPYVLWKKESPHEFSLLIFLLGGLFLIIGAILFGWTLYLFFIRGKGTLAPWDPPKHLVVTGPYRHVRNPMISGVLSLLIGQALVLPSLNIAAWAAIFFVVNTFYFRFSEEPGLEKRFGEEYRIYKQHVRRWVPRGKSFRF